MHKGTFKAYAAAAEVFYTQKTWVWRVHPRPTLLVHPTLGGSPCSCVGCVPAGWQGSALYLELEEAQLFGAVNYVEYMYGISRLDCEDALPDVTLEWEKISEGSYALHADGLLTWARITLEPLPTELELEKA